MMKLPETQLAVFPCVLWLLFLYTFFVLAPFLWSKPFNKWKQHDPKLDRGVRIKGTEQEGVTQFGGVFLVNYWFVF